MPLHRARSFPVRSGRPRRRTTWVTARAAGVAVATGVTPNATDLLADWEVAGSSLLGVTIMRTHLSLSVAYATTDTNPGVTVGFLVETAGTPNRLIDPSSAVQEGFDWMLLHFIPPALVNRQAFVTGTTILAGHEYDMKGKRKMHQLGERYFFTIHNGGSASVTYSYLARILLALP